jgi:hypothetical protein
MSKARVIGAGSAGSTIYHCNVNLNTAGGNKKQGLPFQLDRRTFQNRDVKIKATGDKRDYIFTMNQIGGIGRIGWYPRDGIHYLDPYQYGSKPTIPTTTTIPQTTILVYNTDQGSNIVWDEVTFTRNTDLQNFSYTSTITFIPAIQVPFNVDLKEVTIGNLVITIGSYAFSGCTGLSSVTIPNSVKNIGTQAFLECTNLSSVTIPNSVTTIRAVAFQGCTNLESITIPNSVILIGNNAFQYSGLKFVTIENGQLGKPSPNGSVSFFGVTVETLLPS